MAQPAASDYAAYSRFIDALTLALEKHRLTFLTYQSQAATEQVTYDVHPYGVVFRRGSL